MYIFLGLLLVVCVGVCMALLRKSDSVEARKQIIWEPITENFPYIKRPRLLNYSEAAFFHILRQKLPPGFHADSHVRIADLIDSIGRDDMWKKKIMGKHVDFVIRGQYSKPVVAIEINGKSHLAPQRQERDEFVRKVFAAATFPLETVRVGEDFAQAAENIVKKYTS